MARVTSHKHKKARHALPKPGSSPGMVYIDEQALEPVITVYAYQREKYEVYKLTNPKDLKNLSRDKQTCFWVEIMGLKAESLFDCLNNDFGINKLVLEDITRTYQRPKYEEFDDYDFALSRMLFYDEQHNLESGQISFILTDNILFSFQEKHEDLFLPVKKRLEGGKGTIRYGGSSYLMYTLMDMIIDQYFDLLGSWSEQLDNLEDQLLDNPNKSILYETQLIKRYLITMRRTIWAERDKLNDMLRMESKFIHPATKAFLKDAYDHCIQVIDMTESLKEIATSNIDMYLSIISNRMNEIMKVLTIISSIFIPLTFIAGIYGMNFSRQDPITGKIMPQNMPELYQEHGYLYTILVMTVIALLQIMYFWKKGWFK